MSIVTNPLHLPVVEHFAILSFWLMFCSDQPLHKSGVYPVPDEPPSPCVSRNPPGLPRMGSTGLTPLGAAPAAPRRTTAGLASDH